MSGARINNYDVLGSSSIKWRLKSGTNPVIETFDMVPSEAEALFNEREAVTLYMDDDDNEIEIKNLYVLNIYPGENEDIMRVVLADRRWFWSYAHVLRRYNIRRNIGTKRIKNPVALELQPVVKKVWYAKYSLKNEQPWKAREIIEDVIDAVLDIEEVTTKKRPSILYGIGNNQKTIPFENVTIDDSGDQAINRVLSYMPDVGIYIDYKGNVRVYDRTNKKEKDIIDELDGEVIGQGHVEHIDTKKLRPSAINVLFSREVEVRYDFEEASSVNETGILIEDDRIFENVLPIPDFELTVGSDTLCQGTWITFTEALSAWGAPPGLARQLDYDDLQKAFVPFMDLWAGILLLGQQAPNADWTARVSTIQQHYRRTYRINRHWMDRILSLRAYRVATVDQSTGQRSPAVAYADYCVIGSQRSFFMELASGKDLSYAINKKNYPANGIIDENTLPAPARLTILDEDQGIIHIDYLIDPYRVHEQILPSMIFEDGSNIPAGGLPINAGPTADITNRNRPISFNAIGNIHKPPRLTPQHKIAIILSVIPASPNNKNQLHKIKITPNDVASELGSFIATGPEMNIRIGSGVETARIAWNDAKKDDIEKLFGVQQGQPNLKGLVLNEDEVISGGASLNAIAKAMALRVYASLLDRFQGTTTGNLSAVNLNGWAEEITHEVTTSGQALTRLTLPERIPQFNMLSFLDSSSRAVLLKLAKPGK